MGSGGKSAGSGKRGDDSGSRPVMARAAMARVVGMRGRDLEGIGKSLGLGLCSGDSDCDVDVDRVERCRDGQSIWRV